MKLVVRIFRDVVPEFAGIARLLVAGRCQLNDRRLQSPRACQEPYGP